MDSARVSTKDSMRKTDQASWELLERAHLQPVQVVVEVGEHLVKGWKVPPDECRYGYGG
jgi:hypothetical protein